MTDLIKVKRFLYFKDEIQTAAAVSLYFSNTVRKSVIYYCHLVKHICIPNFGFNNNKTNKHMPMIIKF